MNRKQIPNLLAFLVLMGGREMLGKSPDYIMEKAERYLGTTATLVIKESDEWKYGLDSTNQRILMEYTQRWMPSMEEKDD